jgi:hypothetical protein
MWAAALLALTACGGKPVPARYTVNDPTDANTTWKSEKPLTYSEAASAGKCPLALPSTATNIQYINFYAGFGGYSQFVRFEAPVEDCRNHARKVLEARNARMTEASLRVSVAASPLAKSIAESLAREARQGVEEVARAPWFDADAIRNGEIWGERGSSKPIILIDTDRGIFYYSLSD